MKKLERTHEVEIENDCEDQGFSLMPEYCEHGNCVNLPKNLRKLQNRNGFMTCPNCNGSYGPMNEEKKADQSPEAQDLIQDIAAAVYTARLYEMDKAILEVIVESGLSLAEAMMIFEIRTFQDEPDRFEIWNRKENMLVYRHLDYKELGT